MLQTYLHWFGFGLCHQLPERSFFGGGVQLPVCARDTGIYFGFCLAVALTWFLHRPERPREFPTPTGWVVFALMLGSMALDGVTEYSGLRSTTNELRLITGLAAGFAIAMLVVPMLNDTLWRLSHRVHVLDPGWRLAVFSAAVPVAYVVLWWGAPLLGVGYAILATLAILVTLTCVNLVMVGLLPWFDRKAETWTDILTPAALAFVLACFEIFLAGMLRVWLNALAARIS